MSDGGQYRGPRSTGCDYFDDIMGDNDVPAIFQTPQGGMGAYESVRPESTPEGIVVHMFCRPPGCGNGRNVTITWAELFIVAHAPQTGVLPDGWARSEVNAACYPMLECRCGQPIAPMIAPDWAMRQVNSALSQNLTNMQAIGADPQVMRLRQQAAYAQQQQQMPPGGGGYYR